MGKGRKPTPLPVKELRGTARKDRTNKRAPRPEPNLAVDVPARLDRDGKAEWERGLAELTGAGIMTPGAAGMLWFAAYWWQEALIADRELRKRGHSIVGVMGGIKNAPAFARANVAFRNYRSAASELGLTPASRERLTVNTPEDDGGLEEWLKKGAEARARRAGRAS